MKPIQTKSMTSSLVRVPIVFLVLGAPPFAGAQKVQAFNPKDYPAGTFQVTENHYTHGQVTVRVLQAKKATPDASSPHACRAWFEVKKEDRLLKRLYYDDIEAVGFSYGIFVPKRQPLPDYFVAVKEGDYDGRLLLVAKNGTLANLPGGFYFLTTDQRFVVGEHATDSSELVVIDVVRRQVVIDGSKSREIPPVENWYQDGAGYFFTEPDASDQAFPPREKQGFVYRLDLEHHRVVKAAITSRELAAARKIAYDFDPLRKENCTSKQQ